MAGPWLYAIAARPGYKFALKGNRSRTVTFESYRELVLNKHIADDPNWGYRQGKSVEVGDEVFIYTGDQDLGIIGYATVENVDREDKRLDLNWDFAKCETLLESPVAAAKVRGWQLNLRPNLVNLSPVERRLRASLPPDFDRPTKINIEQASLNEKELDDAIRKGQLRIGAVPARSELALSRLRRGQARIRQLALRYYGNRCAVCDITEKSLLVASHIVGWAAAPEHRGKLSNVICLCRIHDALFEAGYWSLDDKLKLLRKRSVSSQTIRQLLKKMDMFRTPQEFPPNRSFVKSHRTKSGFRN